MKRKEGKVTSNNKKYGIIKSMEEMEEVLNNICEHVRLDKQKNIINMDGIIIYKFKYDR